MDSNFNISNHKEAIIHFISKLDLQMLDALLYDQFEYNEYGKDDLLYNFEIIFKVFAEAGDDYLEVHRNSCACALSNECISAVTFVGNNSRRFLDLIIETEKCYVVDIYECTEMNDYYMSSSLSTRIYLDQVPF